MTKQFPQYILAIFLIIVSFSCSVKFPRAISENPMGSLIGKATKTTYLGLFSVGDDTSIELAAKNGNIKYITSVDYQYTDILGLISTQTVIVSGSNEAPITSQVEKDTSPRSQLTEKQNEKPGTKSIEKSIEKTIVESGTQVAEKVNEIESQINKSVSSKTDVQSKFQNSDPQNNSRSGDIKTNKNGSVSYRDNNTKTEVTESIEKPEVIVPEEVKNPARKIKGFTIKAKSMSELAAKIKSLSTEYMQYGDLNPIDIKLNINTLTFSCNFMAKETGFIKLGLYFGPKSTGCVSCENVLNNNSGSVVINQGVSNIFDYQLIAIYSK